MNSIIQNQFANQLNKRRRQLNQDIETYVKKSLHDFDNLKDEYVTEMIKFLDDTNEDTTCGCLLAVCRIRNNLMHGIKDIGELDEQIDLFRAANKVLENIHKR